MKGMQSIDLEMYQQTIESLLYLVFPSRPDILLAVSVPACF